jgi:hypothetical protein
MGGVHATARSVEQCTAVRRQVLRVSPHTVVLARGGIVGKLPHGEDGDRVRFA